MEVHQKNAEPWEATLLDTGETTLTGGRLKRVQRYVGDETFCHTYGDGVADVDISAAIATHRASDKLATLTAVQQPGRYWALNFVEGDQVAGFQEKPQGDGGWINGGFFVLEPGVFDTIHSDDTSWEGEPLQRLAAGGQLQGYLHPGFWQPMVTLRDKAHLEELWESAKAPWKRW